MQMEVNEIYRNTQHLTSLFGTCGAGQAGREAKQERYPGISVRWMGVRCGVARMGVVGVRVDKCPLWSRTPWLNTSRSGYRPSLSVQWDGLHADGRIPIWVIILVEIQYTSFGHKPLHFPDTSLMCDSW